MVVRQQRLPEELVDSDPLFWALAPPADETPAQRAVREAEEKDARLISERIDEEIRKEKHHNLKGRPVKVILVGQEESEKSGFLRDFRELYARQACRGESPIWRAVVRLNLVRSVNKILDALGKIHRTPDIDKIRKRLSPLGRAQRDLEKHLGLTDGEQMRATAIHQLAKQGRHQNLLEKAMKVVISSRDDITILWGDDDVRAILKTHGTHLDEHSRFFLDNIHRIMEKDYEPSDDDVSRVRSRTAPGVQEYHYLLDTGSYAGSEWIFYDVGYSRTQRASWIPYLMEANALVFRASLSVFDQYFEDDPEISRLEDTYMFWTVICKSRLISKMQLILLLSGSDDLRIKLERGIPLKRYITSYGDRPNDIIVATKYLRGCFLGISRKNSIGSEPRHVYVHSTSSDGPDRCVVGAVMTTVRQGIMRDYLRTADIV